MREITLHLIDIVENSVSAGATAITVTIEEDLRANRLMVSVRDNGKGMDAETAARIVDPFVTSRTTRKVGLGLPLFKAAAQACNGDLAIQSEVGRGTTVSAWFEHDHIDRMPLGDVAGTFLSLLIAHPETHWRFHHHLRAADGSLIPFDFDDAPIKETLEGLPLTEPDVLAYLRELFAEVQASSTHL